MGNLDVFFNQSPKRTDQEINQVKAANDLLTVVSRDLSFKKEGLNYVACCPFHQEKTPSFKIKQGEQFFKCFGCDAKGDVFDYLMKTRKIDFNEAFEQLSGRRLASSPTGAPKAATPKAEPVDWVPIMPIPLDAPKPDYAHYKHDKPSKVFIYRDSSGAVLGYNRRYETQNGKEFVPLTYCQSPTGEKSWRPKQFPAPRPLYGLDRLAAMPSNLPILVVEGEKACDAAQRLLPDYVCLSWPGGSQAAHLANWTPLTGRNVTTLPDADEPGLKAAIAIMEILS